MSILFGIGLFVCVFIFFNLGHLIRKAWKHGYRAGVTSASMARYQFTITQEPGQQRTRYVDHLHDETGMGAE